MQIIFFSTIPFSGVLKTAELLWYFNLLFSVKHSVLWNWGPLVGSLSRFLCYQLLWLLTCRCWRKKSWIFIANCSLSLGSWVLWKKGLSKVGHTPHLGFNMVKRRVIDYTTITPHKWLNQASALQGCVIHHYMRV